MSVLPLTDYDRAVIQQGATFEYEGRWEEGGSPVDITGATGVMDFTNDFGSPLAFSGTFSIVNASEGRFKVTVSAATTAAYTPELGGGKTEVTEGLGRQYELLAFDLRVTLSGTVYPLVIGTARFYPSATYGNATPLEDTLAP